MEAECDICGRGEGSELDRCGVHDGVPLGPIEACETCGRNACPDCLHEADCCFDEADEHKGEPDWAPLGWARTNRPRPAGLIEFIRVN